MEIVIIVHQFFPRWYTGTERMALNNAKQLKRMGHNVEIITYGITDDTNEFDQEFGQFLIRKYYFENVPVTAIKQKIVPLDIDFQIFNADTEKVLTHIISERKPDIIHICHPSRLGSIVKTAHDLGIPVVLSITDLWMICPKAIAISDNGRLCHGSKGGRQCITQCNLGQNHEKILKRNRDSLLLLEQVDNVVFATTFLQNFFKAHGNIQNSSIIRFGIDYAFVQKNLTKYSERSMLTFGFLSVLTPHKGAHILIEAFNCLSGRNVRLKVYGDFFWNHDYNNQLQSLAKNNSQIEFCGPYDYENMPHILNQIDILVLPSLWWENTPLVLLTAGAHTVPAVVTDLGGMTEIVRNNENGWCFEAGNIQALALVLEKICLNPEDLNTIKQNIVSPPRIEEESFSYEHLYEYIINHRIAQS